MKYNITKFKKCVYCNIFYIVNALIAGVRIKDTIKVEILSYSFDVNYVFLAGLVVVATSLSFWAVYHFEKDKYLIQNEAKKVEVEESVLGRIERKFDFITCRKVICCSSAASLLSYFVIEAAQIDWKEPARIYAYMLVGGLISITLYGYIYFLLLVFCISDVYNSEFQKYVLVYPIATDIFEKYTRICFSGIIHFWAIGIILIILSFMVFDAGALVILAIMGALILFGYLVFTFYPYYITRKKISMLKMQTVRNLCSKNNMLEKESFTDCSEIIKFVSDSPNALSTNFQLIITSTIAAIAGLLTPLLSFFK